MPVNTRSGTIEETQNPSRDSPAAREASASAETIRENLAAARQRIQELEELIQARESIRLLEERIASDSQAPRRRHNSDSQSSHSDSDIRIRNITSLPHWATYQQRDNWLRDLRRKFEASPKTFRRDKKRILIALDHTDSECRARWDRYLEEQTEETHLQYENDWENFKEWSKTLLKYTDQGTGSLATQLEGAKQREGQHPLRFHDYLDALEKQRDSPLESDLTRALYYYGKLTDDLKAKIRLQASELPVTRVAMVETATRVYEGDRELQRLQGKRKSTNEGASSSKTPRQRLNQQSSNRTPYIPKGSVNATPVGPHGNASGTADTPKANPLGTDGRVLRCLICQSTTHLIRQCPRKAKIQQVLEGYTKN